MTKTITPNTRARVGLPVATKPATAKRLEDQDHQPGQLHRRLRGQERAPHNHGHERSADARANLRDRSAAGLEASITQGAQDAQFQEEPQGQVGALHQLQHANTPQRQFVETPRGSTAARSSTAPAGAGIRSAAQSSRSSTPPSARRVCLPAKKARLPGQREDKQRNEQSHACAEHRTL